MSRSELVRALNSVFQKWGILAQPDQWNISGEPCSGVAIVSTNFDDTSYNPMIKCDCSTNSNSTCHITQLRTMDFDFPLQSVWFLLYMLVYLRFASILITFFFMMAHFQFCLLNLLSPTFDRNLGQNHLTGNLSASIGNLTRMQYLSLGINALSGTLPKELGYFTELISLALSTNEFSGPLPSELGNLVKLQQL
uniref:LRR receptor-like serine/threonine-protein kinase n=1 Tax=Quercus lobata TaxID=97700 RepID=A0A7N2LH52_QUELO